MGKQSLYNVIINIDIKGYGESDSWNHHFGFRKIESHIDGATGGRYYGFQYSFNVMIFFFFLGLCFASCFHRLFKVNGEPIFIRGGNWILSDGLLRLSKKRYETDIKFHADMNFNMIRCWGGGLTERPEFYHYCDYYGLLVRFTTPSFFFICAAQYSFLVIFFMHLLRQYCCAVWLYSLFVFFSFLENKHDKICTQALDISIL